MSFPYKRECLFYLPKKVVRDYYQKVIIIQDSRVAIELGWDPFLTTNGNWNPLNFCWEFQEPQRQMSPCRDTVLTLKDVLYYLWTI